MTMSPAAVTRLVFVLCCLSLLGCGYQFGDDDGVISYSTLRMRRRLYAKRRHRTICDMENDEINNRKLREVVKKSEFVFTAKVLGHFEEGDTGDATPEKQGKRRRGGLLANSIGIELHGEEERSQTFQVEIKRVMKGGERLGGVKRIAVRVPKEFVSGVEVTSDSALNSNCIEFHPVLKLRQTAILLAKSASPGVLELTSFPVAMTLRHLDRVDAAVTGYTWDLGPNGLRRLRLGW